MPAMGKVYLIGAGPGDPDLMTVKALKALGRADVVVHDRLVSDEVLALAPRKAALLSVGKAPKQHPVPQHEINALLVRLAQGGLTVARLKGGDPLIFGRGGEEALELIEAGIPFEIIPGITSAQACAAQFGIPLTHRGLATSVRYLTGHCKEDEPLALDWKGLADGQTTLVIYMGFAQIRQVAVALMRHGMDPSTPAAAVANGARADARSLRSTIGEIAADLERSELSNPVTIFVGEAIGIELVPSAPARPALRLVAREREALHA